MCFVQIGCLLLSSDCDLEIYIPLIQLNKFFYILLSLSVILFATHKQQFI